MPQRILFAIVGLIIGLGPTPFEQWHLSHLQSIAPPVAIAWTHRPGMPIPQSDKPARPAHNPNNCTICVNLHAPLSSGFVAQIVIGPPSLLGRIELPLIQQTQRFCITSIDCRGPPLV